MLVQRLAKDFSTALDQHAGNLLRAQITQENIQVVLAEDQGSVGETIIQNARFRRQRSGARQHYAPRLPCSLDPANGELRIIDANRFSAHKDGVDLSA
jgi:hypothetical protein